MQALEPPATRIPLAVYLIKIFFFGRLLVRRDFDVTRAATWAHRASVHSRVSEAAIGVCISGHCGRSVGTTYERL